MIVRNGPRKVWGYGLGLLLFTLALGFTSSVSWIRGHYPYLAYWVASLATCYIAGIGPANLAAALSAVAVYMTFTPGGLFVAATQTPLTAAATVLILMVGINGMIGWLKQSRDRLALERERYERLAESRDLLYRELQHRVSNNISIISGLLLLQSQAVGDGAAKRALAEASGRINLIARIQRQLQDRTGEPTPFRTFAEELLADAVAAAGAESVQVEFEGGETPMHVEQATPVSLVLLECVNNALEHALQGGPGLVRVSLTEEDGQALLTVSDNGTGLPDGFSLEGSRSLGLKIVRTMAFQLGGSFSITPGEVGCICRLRFPLISED